MRVGFLYGYFAEDPFYKNGIRAIVEAIYEPKQVCTYDSFEIKDSDDRKMKVELIAESLGLQKLGIIISTHNDKVIFTESDVRMIARMQ